MRHHLADIGLQSLRVGRIVERNDPVPLGLTRLGEGPHRREECEYLLDVVRRVIGLLRISAMVHVLARGVEPQGAALS